MPKSENLRCPSCKTKLSTSKHYDATFEWFECPKCEGCFTYDEILEGGGGAIVEDVETPVKTVKKKSTPEPESEEEGPRNYYKGEVPTKEVVNIMADEIQAIYEEMGIPQLEDYNAQDKALQLVRVLRVDSKVKITEGEVKHVLCAIHSD